MYDCVAHNSCTLHGTSPSTTDLEGLGMIINYAATLRPFGTTTDIINDISTILLGTSGAFTPVVAYLVGRPPGFSELGGSACVMGSSLHYDYGARQCGQIWHFWAYLTSFAAFDILMPAPDMVQPDNPSWLGQHIGVIADIHHECIDPYGTIVDARLTSASLEIATNRSITPINLADTIVNTLSSGRRYGTAGALAWWYYHWASCQSIAQNEWQDRHTDDPNDNGDPIPPVEFQSLSIPPELQCWGLVC
jgi:hypothetical protein